LDQFTVADLSELARNGHLEQAYNEETRGQGSFLGNALNVWGLDLVRWRSEAMESAQSHPHTQFAFLLNRNQHWYTLRRFGPSAENCRWFRLDSSQPSPQWISKADLGMILQQAERDGYSLFVVVPIDPEAPLHHTEADDFASTLEPEPTFEGEDMELQAALQASLMCGVGGGPSSGSAFNMSGGHPPPLVHSRLYN